MIGAAIFLLGCWVAIIPNQVAVAVFIGKSLIGLGLGALYVSVLLATAEVDASRSALALGLAVTGSGVGQPVVSWFVGRLLLLGWRTAYGIMSVLGLAAIFLSLILPTKRADVTSECASALQSRAASPADQQERRRGRSSGGCGASPAGQT